MLPGTLPVAELARRLADTDAAVVMKLGRTYPQVREALSLSGRLDDAVYVERASTAGQRVMPAAEVDDGDVPYFSLAILAGRRRADSLPGTVAVVGLGPGDTDWMTPQSRREVAAATDLIGYGPHSTGSPRAGPAPASFGQHRRTPARPTGLRTGRTGPCRRGGVLRRSRRIRHGHRGSRGGQTVARGRGAGDPGDDGRPPSPVGRRTTRSRLCGAVAVRPAPSRGRSSPIGSRPRPPPTWCWRSTTRRRRVGPGRWARCAISCSNTATPAPGCHRPGRVRSERIGDGGSDWPTSIRRRWTCGVCSSWVARRLSGTAPREKTPCSPAPLSRLSTQASASSTEPTHIRRCRQCRPPDHHHVGPERNGGVEFGSGHRPPLFLVTTARCRSRP